MKFVGQRFQKLEQKQDRQTHSKIDKQTDTHTHTHSQTDRETQSNAIKYTSKHDF